MTEIFEQPSLPIIFYVVISVYLESRKVFDKTELSFSL